jgi:glycosyltransferase involved in cell wall biosynthesis
VIVCLLPARDEAANIAGYLESAGRFADAVVALDDGSWDDTRELLEASPLVRVLIANPRRPTYAGWDDSANRNRLLAAAADLGPDWIVSLDADERLDADDARALRGFLRAEALPGCAYGFQHFRTWGSSCESDFSWIYRAFAFEPGQRFTSRRLHFEPVPVEIAPDAWMHTTIRVRHLAASTPELVRERLGKYREADPAGEYGVGFGGMEAEPRGPLHPWLPRAEDLPVLLPASAGRPPIEPALPPAPVPAPARPTGRRTRTKLVCLLPARNCERDLTGWFESVERIADAVVALDDGSTDGTRELLAAHPLVREVLTNPRRDGYAGWDDAANRNRLLSAAGELEPDWILWLDADERIDAEDAAALREFVDGDALRGLAYGFRVFRMIGGLDNWDRGELWVYRLFAYEPGQQLPEGRLHALPVPDAIPRSRWLRTSLRIQHLAGLDDTRRRERFDKYSQADPDLEWQQDYARLLEPPGELHPWEPRAPGAPALAAGAAGYEADAPLLTAIVIARDDEERIERTVRSVVDQVCPEPFEVIVVVSGRDRTADVVRECFPEVRLVDLGSGALPGVARNAGLRLARGDYVSFPGSHVELPPGSLAARLGAHEQGHAMVTGTILNGTTTCAGWASYFLDHSTVLPGRPSGLLPGAPAHCSYARHLLLSVGGFPEHLRAGEDTVVNQELAAFQYKAYRARDVRLVHASPCRGPVRLMRHHFLRGRGLGRILLDDYRGRGRLISAGFIKDNLVRYVPRRVRGIGRHVGEWGGPLRPVHRRVLPLVIAGAASACAGLWYELLRPEPGKARALLGRRRRSQLGAAEQRAGG